MFALPEPSHTDFFVLAPYNPTAKASLSSFLQRLKPLPFAPHLHSSTGLFASTPPMFDSNSPAPSTGFEFTSNSPRPSPSSQIMAYPASKKYVIERDRRQAVTLLLCEACPWRPRPTCPSPVLSNPPSRSMPQIFHCSHTCGCTYSSLKREIRRHIPLPRPHPHCTQDCPHYGDISRPGIRIETPESYVAKQERHREKKPNGEEGPVVKTSRILCILDPLRRAESFKDTTYDVAWITAAELSPEEVKEVLGCSELKGYVFRIRGRKNVVRIYGWAYVMFFSLREQKNKCTVEFSTWEAFSEQLTTRPLKHVVGDLRERQIDCLFGAIDLSIRPPSIESAECKAREALLALSDVFPVFPSPKGCNRFGMKVDFVQTLDFIARRMETARPRSKPWHPKIQEPPHGWVLKREFSDQGRHVYVPNRLSNNERDVRLEKKRVEKFIRDAESNKDPENMRWLAQEYVPTLASVGEFHFICVNGEPIRVAITSKRANSETTTGELCVTEGIRTMLGLEQIRSLVKRQIPVNASNVLPSNQSIWDIRQAQEEMEQFVKVFLKHLKDQDELNSSLQVFCRVDVGILSRPPNIASYFVNEVERGITASLWVGEGSHAAGMVGMGIVTPLKHWIAMEKIRLDVREYYRDV